MARKKSAEEQKGQMVVTGCEPTVAAHARARGHLNDARGADGAVSQPVIANGKHFPSTWE